MSDKTKYFEFVADAVKNLPERDKERMGELWRGFEQVIGSAYQKIFESKLNSSVEDQIAFSDSRWLPYSFNSENARATRAVYRTNQDLALPINLSIRHLIRFSWDNKPPITVSLRGSDPLRTKIEEIVLRINIAAGFSIVRPVAGNALLEFQSPTTGISSRLFFYPQEHQASDASELVLGLFFADTQAIVFPDFPFSFNSPYPRLVSVPRLQDAIRTQSEEEVLIEGADYVLREGRFFFKSPPSPDKKYWSKRNLFNEEWPWNNFGFLLDIYQKNSSRYVDVIKGLWFSFWTGPKPANLQKALYLLFELPTSPFDGIISRVTLEHIDVTSFGGETVQLKIPPDLKAIVSLGQRVEAFDPLVDGISVFDKVNNPGFIEREIGRFGIQRFLLDNASRGPGPDTDETKALRALEEYTFLPQISVSAFVSPDVSIGNVRLFLDAIKPVIKTYLFQVIVGTFEDEVDIGDRESWLLDIDVTPSVDSNETTFLQQSTLLAHETVINPGLLVDSEGFCGRDSLEVLVYEGVNLIDIFEVV